MSVNDILRYCNNCNVIWKYLWFLLVTKSQMLLWFAVSLSFYSFFFKFTDLLNSSPTLQVQTLSPEWWKLKVVTVLSTVKVNTYGCQGLWVSAGQTITLFLLCGKLAVFPCFKVFSTLLLFLPFGLVTSLLQAPEHFLPLPSSCALGDVLSCALFSCF